VVAYTVLLISMDRDRGVFLWCTDAESQFVNGWSESHGGSAWRRRPAPVDQQKL